MSIQDLCGFRLNKPEIDRISFMQPFPLLRSAIGALPVERKTVLLYQYVQQLLGEFPVQVQETGDCCAFGSAHCLDTLKAVEILLRGDFEEWVGLTCTEHIYGGSRCIPELGNNIYRGQQGSNVVWCAQLFRTYGSIVRGKYDKYDLTKYNVNTAINWGNNGVPKVVLEAGKDRTVNTITRITSDEEVIFSLVNGYPIIVAGNAAFKTIRDKNGFSDVNPNDSWPHCQAALGIRFDLHPDGDVLVQNSWPKGWNSGGSSLNQPWGSYWLRMSTFCETLLDDSWAISSFNGFPARKLSLRWA